MKTIMNDRLLAKVKYRKLYLTAKINLCICVLLLLPGFSGLFAQKPEMVVQMGHSQDVLSVAFSPDGKYCLTGSNDNTAKIWDAASGKLIRTLMGHAEIVYSAAFSPDGKHCITASFDGVIKIWDINSGKELKSFQANKSCFNSVVFSPDGNYCLIGIYNKTLELWDLVNGKKIKTFTGHTQDITSAAFSPDGKLCLSGSRDKSLKLWDIASGNEIRIFLGHGNEVTTVAFSPDGKYCLSGSMDYTFKLWDVATGKEIRTFNGLTSSVEIVKFSPDGKFCLSGCHNGTLKLWNINSGESIRTFPGYSNSIKSVSISPDGSYFAVAEEYSKIIKLWDIKSGKEIRTFSGHSNAVFSSVFSPNGKYFLSGGGDSTLKLWDIGSARIIRTFKGNTSVVHAVAFSRDGKYCLSGSENQDLILWNVESGTMVKKFAGHEELVESVAFSPDGKYCLSGGFDGLKLWDVTSGKEISEQALGWVHAVVFSPDGKQFLSGSAGGAFTLWDAATGDEIRTFFTNEEIGVTSVAFSPDGKFCLSGSTDKKLKLWNVANGTEVRTFTGHTNAVSCLAYSPYGKQCVSGGWDMSIKLWDIATGKLIKNFKGHSYTVRSVSFSTDGKRVISASEDGTTRIWDVATGEWTAFTANADASQWLVYNSKGFWDASPNGGDFVAMVNGLEYWNIDQFAVKNNRPDLILKQLNSDDKDLIIHYNVQYQKRLKKLGLTEDKLKEDYHVPKAEIKLINQNEKMLALNFVLTDNKYPLKRYNIFVNDVPIFGSYGKSIKGNQVELSDTIELITGENKIEISCTNETETESFRALTSINYDKPVTRNLYYLGFGVSKYQDTVLNLGYAHKDALDLEQTFLQMKGKGFENIYTKAYINEQVTPENIKVAKEFLKNARPDDYFVLFIAGHGVHDRDAEATYYFLTYNTDLNNLAGTAANFDFIEGLLQGIAPRNKLFLMDACQSGEIDNDEIVYYLNATKSRGLKSRGFKPLEVKQSLTENRAYLNQKDRFIYNDLLRRSGAIVFSSSKGGELSYEYSNLENGLFTEYIMKALSGEADADRNNIVSTDELRNYVSKEVGKASREAQHPTVDRDNIYQKFGFGVVK